MSKIIFLLLMVVTFGDLLGQTVGDRESLENELLEKRAVNLGKIIRCVVCKSESIEDSNAPLAEDMRRFLRHHMTEGASDQEILTMLVNRYGTFVLLEPPFEPIFYILWIVPWLIFGMIVIFLSYRFFFHKGPRV